VPRPASFCDFLDIQAIRKTPDGQETVLHSMEDAGGDFTYAGLAIDQAAGIYGITSAVVSPKNFKVTPDGGFSSIYESDYPDPTYKSLMVDQQGNLYGTTSG